MTNRNRPFFLNKVGGQWQRLPLSMTLEPLNRISLGNRIDGRREATKRTAAWRGPFLFQNPKAHVRERIRPIAREFSEMKVSVDAKTEENLTVLKDILSQKLGKAASLAEVVAWAAEVTREKFDPLKKAERSRAISLRKSIPKPGRQPIQAAVHHAIVRRDQMQCTYISPDGRRCEMRRWLKRHHVKEISKGGRNTVPNLRLLCSAHHHLIHGRPGRPTISLDRQLL